MRNTINVLLALLTVALMGCDGSEIDTEEREAIVRRLAEQYYLQNVQANNGYEFVELTVVDTILYKDNIEFRRKYFQEQVEYNQKMLAIAQQKQDSFPAVNFADKAEAYQHKIDQANKVMAGIDSLENVLGDRANEVASYTYRYKLKANNGQGQKELKEYYLQTNPGFGVLKFVSSPNELFPNPNDFPGYREMAAAILK